ncbi:hypothetical protein FRB94_001295 [Tulasnella sp. JGI-2019a]|nr:hypothetical protein FRB94_001295 [Tulasnella sp. JGI-2019a]KAG9037113.1 hypothetical protein FRB95_006667 [Tulasnella sp. JGI-2019a]
MFKKDHRTKPSAPLKNSERRKLRAQIVQDFNIQPPEDGDLLVPEGLHSAKFITSSDENGTVYIDPSTSDPLWFSIGKSTGLIPTVYTLWKRPLLVCISTPAAAIEKIAGGADLMIPGVVSITPPDVHLPKLPKDALVSVTEYGKSVPLAVGQLTMTLRELTMVYAENDVKGKAVIVLHTFGDALWAAGSKSLAPGEVLGSKPSDETKEEGEGQGVSKAGPSKDSSANDALPQISQTADQEDLTPADIDLNLRQALLQAVTQTIPKHPHALPCTASHFLSNFLQPSRPHSSPPLDLKKSSFKTFSKFLKSVEKEGMLKTKETKDVITVVSVNATHPEFVGHRSFQTAGEVQAKEKAKADREKAAEAKVAPMAVEELWKPFGTTVALFEAKDKDISVTYTRSQVRDLINAHIASNSLAHPREAAFIVPDDLLRNVLRKKGEEPVEFLRRNDLLQAVMEAMQPWHRIEGGTPKKGSLKPILIETKTRSAGKWVTTIIGFEDYAHGPHASDLTAEQLSEDLCKLCATATTTGPVPAAPKGSKAMEVVLQGKHSRKVADFLMSKGVPKVGIEEKTKEPKKKK